MGTSRPSGLACSGSAGSWGSIRGKSARFGSSGRPSSSHPCSVGQGDVAGLVNPNCFQCFDFAVNFSDVSVGRVGGEELFEAAVIRTELGESAVDRAIKDGFLMPSTTLYAETDVAEEERRTLSFLNAMVDIKKELTRRLR